MYAAAEARAKIQLEEMQIEVLDAQKAVKVADERATAAELAKIQLSIQLAEMDNRAFAGSNLGDGENDGKQDFAQNVTAQRAIAAEQEVEELRQKLSKSEAAISQLEFQVCLSFLQAMRTSYLSLVYRCQWGVVQIKCLAS